MNEVKEIVRIAETLAEMSTKLDMKPLDKLLKAAEAIGKSWSGSWLGYHSRIYYKDLKPAPPRAHFSKEWGFMPRYSSPGTIGDWEENSFETVVEAIHKMAGDPNLDELIPLVEQATICYDESQSRLLSFLSPILQKFKEDTFLKDIEKKVKEAGFIPKVEFIRSLTPTSEQRSRDSNAIEAGLQTPPHISVIADIGSLRSPFTACGDLSMLAKRTASHLKNIDIKLNREEHMGQLVYIGHGRSLVWRDIKDFINERLHLPWDEFNRVSVAGETVIARLNHMLDEAAIAFLILTAEDEQADGGIRARMNVIHEVGLFQGRLGFKKAIILLEEGCEEFSNIYGLGQIRFPKGNINAVTEEIRRVLEREGLLENE